MIYTIEQNKWYVNTTYLNQYRFVTDIPYNEKFIAFEFNLETAMEISLKLSDPNKIFAKMEEEEPNLKLHHMKRIIQLLFKI